MSQDNAFEVSEPNVSVNEAMATNDELWECGVMSNDNQEVLPTLKFQGKTPSSINLQTNTHHVIQQQTPLNKGIIRGCVVLIPVNEILLEPAVVKSIEESIHKSITGLFPTIMETIRSELRVTINEIVDKKVNELRSEMQCELDIQAPDAKLKTLRNSNS